MRLAYVTERFRCSSFVYPMFVILRCSQLQRKKKVDHLIIGELTGIINLKNTRNGERSDLDFGTKLH